MKTGGGEGTLLKKGFLLPLLGPHPLILLRLFFIESLFAAFPVDEGTFLSIKKRIQKSIINQGTSVRIIFS